MTPFQAHKLGLVLLELWRPLRYIGRDGPRCFWREYSYEGVRIGTPAPWRVMDTKAYAKIRALPNRHFTLDEHPGVTFTWRPFSAPTLADFAQVQALRAAAS